MVKRNKSKLLDSDESSDDEGTEQKKTKINKSKVDESDGEVNDAANMTSGSESEPEEGEVDDEDSSSSSESSFDDSKFPDGLDENLMGDAEDRERLQNMTEMEREQELFERLEKREQLKTRMKIEHQLKKDKRKKQKKSHGSKKSKARSVAPGSPSGSIMDDIEASRPARKIETAEKVTKLDAIQRLKEERERKKQNAEIVAQQKKKVREEQDKSEDSKTPLRASDIYSDDDDDSENESTNAGVIRPRKKSESSSSSSSSSSSDDDKSDDEGGADDEKESEPRFISTLEELSRIKLSRHKLTKWCHAPFFAEAVTNTFVRVNLGAGPHGAPTYRVAQVVGVVETAKVYTIDNVKTNKGLRLRYVKAERVYRLEFISNHPFNESEFIKWRSDMMAADITLPTLDSVIKKQRYLIHLSDYNYTDNDIEAILAEKKRFRHNPMNYAIAKTDLLKAKLEAEESGDIEKLQQVQASLEELEDRASSLDKQRTQNISAITYINNRNRMRNMVEAEKAAITEYKQMKDKGDDPFTRRKSRPTLVTKAREGVIDQSLLAELRLKSMQHLKKSQDQSTDSPQPPETSGGGGGGGGGPLTLLPGLPLTAASLTDTSTKSGREDLFSVHDFDINIDLASSSTSNNNSFTLSKQDSLGKDAPIVPRRSLNLDQYKREKGLL